MGMDETKQTAETGSEEGGDQRQQQIVDMGSSTIRTERGTIHTLTIVGQIEGHQMLPPSSKSTKYEHVLPLLATVEESPQIDGLLILLNNGGGEIFHTLPGLDMSESSHKFITAVHKTSAKGWAEERGFLYLRAENGGQLAEAMRSFTSPEAAERPVLLEVFTDKDEDTRVLKNYYHQLK